jgi:hypothetical protein
VPGPSPGARGRLGFPDPPYRLRGRPRFPAVPGSATATAPSGGGQSPTPLPPTQNIDIARNDLSESLVALSLTDSRRTAPQSTL